MPTVLRQAGFDFMVYTHDHEPSHVHVWKAGNELIVNLDDEGHGPAVRENNGMSRKEAKQVWQIMLAQQFFLLAEWRRIHGE